MFFVVVGFGLGDWGRNWRDAHTGKMVSGHGRHVPEFAQHNARAGGDGGLLNARGDNL